MPGTGPALVARPAGGSRGRVVVLGELYGLTDLVHDALGRLAAAGYTAAAPDLFWRSEPGLALPYDEAGRERGFTLLRALNPGAVVDQVRRTLDALGDTGSGPSGLVGFSIGGYLALLAAADGPVDVVVAAYPGWTVRGGAPISGPAPLERAADLGAARVVVVAVPADRLVAADLPEIEARLTAAGVDHQVVTLDDVPHGYACAGRTSSAKQVLRQIGSRRFWEARPRAAGAGGDGRSGGGRGRCAGSGAGRAERGGATTFSGASCDAGQRPCISVELDRSSPCDGPFRGGSMRDVEGTRTFQAPAEAYDRFMGRYSRELAGPFLAFCRLGGAARFLDVGCGPGALTAAAIAGLGSHCVVAIDPAPGFVAACRERHPGIDVRQGPMEELPFGDDEFDCAAAQLVLHFVSDPERGTAEMQRVVRPGGIVAASVWDFAQEMEMLRAFWDAAVRLDPDAPDEARVLRFGRAGELAALFTRAGLHEVEESTLTVSTVYVSFEELWSTFLAGIGPAGAYAVGLPPERRAALRAALADALGRPAGAFRLEAVARVARGVVVASERLATGP